MRRLATAVMALICSSAAHADLRATYVSGEEALTVEANDDGRIRMNSAKPGEYTLLTKDGAFLVFEEEGVVKAAAMADFRAVLDDLIADMWTSLGAEAPPAADPEEAPASSAPMFEEVGPVEVRGRPGRAYREVAEAEESDLEDGIAEEAEPFQEVDPDLWADDEGLTEEERAAAPASLLVVSDDPRLAPLGDAWARIPGMMPSIGQLLGGRETEEQKQFAALLKGRGVLKLDAIELKDVAFEPVDDARFVLPATLLTKAEVKEMLAKGE